MIISEKQIMKLIMFTMSHIELVGLVTSKGIKMNYSESICREATELLNNITRQQPEELKVIE